MSTTITIILLSVSVYLFTRIAIGLWAHWMYKKDAWKSGQIRWICFRCGKKVYRDLNGNKRCGCKASPSPWALMRDYRPKNAREVDLIVEDWHNMPRPLTEDVPLHAYLGWTWDEYGLWVETSEIPDHDAKFWEPAYAAIIQRKREDYQLVNLLVHATKVKDEKSKAELSE